MKKINREDFMAACLVGDSSTGMVLALMLILHQSLLASDRFLEEIH